MSAICKTCEKREFQPGRDVHSVCGLTKEHVWGYVQTGKASAKCPLNNGEVKAVVVTTTAAPATTTPAPTEAPATTTAAPEQQQDQQQAADEAKQEQPQTTTAAPLFNNGMKLGQQPNKRK